MTIRSIAHDGVSIVPKWAWMTAASILAAIVLGLSAQIRFPLLFSPVPVTLQTFALISFAGLLRRHYALMMVTWYILFGIIGMPFFATGGGIQVVSGATGGYLWGFFLAAMVIGYGPKSKASLFKTTGRCLVAAVLIYLPGLLQLHLVTESTWSNTLQMGLYPFVIGDVVKAVAAGVLLKNS